MRSRTFLNVSLGVLALVVAFEIGARTSHAQAPSNPIVAMTGGFNAVVTSNGDIYGLPQGANLTSPWTHYGNVFTGPGPTPAAPTSMGQVKARYR